MEPWNELINGPMRSEIMQLEGLGQQLIESLPFIIVGAFVLALGVVGLFAALDYIFREVRDLTQSNKGSGTGEQYPNSSRDEFPQPATRLLVNDTHVAA